MNTLPPLPKIEGDIDLVLDIYTHSSLRFPSGPDSLNDDYGDTDRLAELGSRILDLAVTFHFYSKKPMLTANEIAEHRDRVLSDEQLSSWLDEYGLKTKLRYAPTAKDEVGSPQELRRFFHTYIGALHIRNGMATIQEWISRLIDPDAPPMPRPFSPTVSDIPPKQLGWGQPFPPSHPPPPLPSPMYQPTPSDVPKTVSLALVNQTAVQHKIKVTYLAEQEGPPHSPTWTVRCMMDDVEKGRGTGASQKKAKEEAARQAWGMMGW
ncbi:hypothetical protein H0H81_003720 [Sphagnurus paluster]|uniref:DRBM domain-containing protein n=1 Tax=Sphagnurus paluster TaxID=117069 RepID=A0A9P7FT37_9AGAR|nr:hypothetical protein H0H81_003720 [Sphagnurus paluster]